MISFHSGFVDVPERSLGERSRIFQQCDGAACRTTSKGASLGPHTSLERRMKRFAQLMLTAAVAAAAPGCIAAAAAAGAGGAVYVTTRGAEAMVEGQPDGLEPRIRSALARHQVTITDTSVEDGGDRQTWEGTAGELTVNVTAERESPTTTKVEVTARKNVADWDKELAERILRDIVQTD